MGVASSFIVDAEGGIQESEDARFRVGETLTVASPWGAAALQALGVARDRGHARTLARDATTGARWLVEISAVAHSPWRARLVAMDATQAIEADRRAVFGKVVHSLQNISFALLSVLEALDLDRPAGAQLDEYVTHLKDPAERLSRTMKHLHGCIVPPTLDRQSIPVSVLLDRALSRVALGSKPASIEIHCPGELAVRVDVDLVSEVLLAMVESGPRTGPLQVAAGVAGTRVIRLSVERSASPLEEQDPASIWDVGGENRAEFPLRLAFARAVVLAHEGTARAVHVSPGRVRLEIDLPQVSDG